MAARTTDTRTLLDCPACKKDGYTISPSIEPVMALIEPHLVIAEAARKWVVAVEDGGDSDWERGFAATDALLAAVDAEQAGGE